MRSLGRWLCLLGGLAVMGCLGAPDEPGAFPSRAGPDARGDAPGGGETLAPAASPAPGDDSRPAVRQAGLTAAARPAGKFDGREPCIHNGDVSLDGQTSAGDAQLAFYIALGQYQPSPTEMCAADCNGDGLVSAGDAQAIFYAALGTGRCPQSLPDGSDCLIDLDCESSHCGNGFCCAAGDCCPATPDACPAGYGLAPACDDPATCQGSRVDATCVDFGCGSTDPIADDTACDGETEASDCGAYPSVFCTGEADQETPECPATCSVPEECDPGMFCVAGACLALLPDGSACGEAAQCQSNHCQNGFCCVSGDCCNAGGDCPPAYGPAFACDDPGTCQGSRRDPSCVSFTCFLGSSTPDDTACTAATLASDCGFYPAVYCTGAAEQLAPQCPAACSGPEQCDPGIYCVFGECLSHLPDGQACGDSAECQSGHCQNGYCCATGDCCVTADDCPAGYGPLYACDDPATCQGSRSDAVCAGFVCDSEPAGDDDTACDAATVASDCGLYPSVFCTGLPEQGAPTCATSCTRDWHCDEAAHCDDGVCVADEPPGTACNEDSDCDSEYCENGFCCAFGDCCGVPADCPADYRSPAVCDDAATCQGERVDATCVDGTCGFTPVADDSACGTTVKALECAPFADAYCTGATEQSPPVCASVVRPSVAGFGAGSPGGGEGGSYVVQFGVGLTVPIGLSAPYGAGYTCDMGYFTSIQEP